MDWKIEVIVMPVTDLDRSKRFYAEQCGFVVDLDHQATESIRLIQMTPPGSGCSITIGTGISEMEPGSLKGLQLVVDDIEVARDELRGRGVQTSDVNDMPWGRFIFFSDPDGNSWAIQQLPPRP